MTILFQVLESQGGDMRKVKGVGVIPVLKGEPHRKEVTGYNNVNRPNQRHHNTWVENRIDQLSSSLRTTMEALQEESRSAFSCAEAHAVALLISAGTVDLSSIRLSIALDETGSELVLPCGNCQAWLDQIEGFGSTRTYKIKPKLIQSQAASSSPEFVYKQSDFPALGAQ
jgi:hypothetical protein